MGISLGFSFRSGLLNGLRRFLLLDLPLGLLGRGWLSLDFLLNLLLNLLLDLLLGLLFLGLLERGLVVLDPRLFLGGSFVPIDLSVFRR